MGNSNPVGYSGVTSGFVVMDALGTPDFSRDNIASSRVTPNLNTFLSFSGWEFIFV